MKRLVDVVGGATLLVVLLPVIVIGLVISALSFRRWPVFVQSRVGLHGRLFRLVKVRTLDPETPAALPKAELEAHRPNAACRFLRGHHLDELPQLLNVLAGSMSLVGPRPELVELRELQPAGLSAARESVRPGLTGLWQISTAAELMIPDHPEFDRYYAEAHTLRLDLWILWRTATGLVGRRPIASLDEIPARVRPRHAASPVVGDQPA